MRKIQRAEAEPFQAFSPTDSAEDPGKVRRQLVGQMNL